jgi:hypothetical protein
MPVRITRRKIEVVEHAGFVDHAVGHEQAGGQLLDQTSDDVSPCLLVKMEMEGLDGLLGGLLSGEACPFVAAFARRGLRLLEISPRLYKPIS